MNTKFISAIFFILITAGIEVSHAQLSGTYTIGGASPDYAAITDAVTDLNSQGISAPVVFDIRDGIYAEKIVLTAVAGASFTNTITFESENTDSTLVTITDPSSASGTNNYTIQFSGGSYFTFHMLTIERSGSLANSRVLDFAGNCQYNNITNCVLTTTAGGTNNSNAIVFSASGTTDSYNIFQYNKIENGSIGFSLYGANAPASPEDGNMIMNNIIENQTQYAIQSGNESEMMISGNMITTNAVSYGGAISLSSVSAASLIMENKIFMPNGGTGISLLSCVGNGIGDIMVMNNFISIGGSASVSAYGIKINGCTNTGIYFNSVNNTCTNTALANNITFNIINGAGANTNVNVLNNIFRGVNGYLLSVVNNGAATMDYNDLFATGGTFGIYASTTCNNFNAWKTTSGKDANSVSVNPAFVSASDLHLTTFILNALATPVMGITTDIDGDLRDTVTPDIGADEFFAPSFDVGVTQILSPLNNACADSMQMVAVIVKNYAAVKRTNIPVDLEITGFVTSIQSTTITDTIDVYQSDTAFFAIPVNTSAGGILNIMAYTSQPNDEDNSNDTLVNVDTIKICIDVGVTKVIAPYNNACGDSAQSVAVIVKNYTQLPQLNIPVEIQISGAVTSTQTTIIPGPIPVNQSDTAFFTMPINTYAGGILDIISFTSLPVDQDTTNDTLFVTDTIIAIPPPPVIPDTLSLCPGSTDSITAVFTPNYQVYWYDAQSGGNLVGTGNPLPVTAVNATYFAELRDTTGGGLANDSLATMNSGGNGSSANFFDVTNISAVPVTVHYLSTLITGTQTATVYYLPGGLTSCTANPVIANFTMVGSVSVIGLGGAGSAYTFIPVDMNVTIPPGQTYAFCISGGNVTYTDGTGTGTCPVFASNTAIAIHEGFGGTTGAPIANRRLNGRVSYSIGKEGCAGERAAVVVNVLAAPSVFLGNDTIIALPNTVTLDAGAGFASYMWSTGDTTQTIVVTATGTYTVVVTDSSGCTATDVLNVTVLVGINSLGSNSEVSVIPNPAKDFMKVILKNVQPSDYKICLLDNFGQQVLLSGVNAATGNAEKIIDLSSVSKGIYYIEVKSEAGIYRQQVLIQ